MLRQGAGWVQDRRSGDVHPAAPPAMSSNVRRLLAFGHSQPHQHRLAYALTLRRMLAIDPLDLTWQPVRLYPASVMVGAPVRAAG